MAAVLFWAARPHGVVLLETVGSGALALRRSRRGPIKKRCRAWLLVASAVASLSAYGCQSPSAPAPAGSLSRFQLDYRLLAAYPDVFWCDPDFYPVARAGQEQQNAIDQFPAIRATTSEFSAILAQLNLPDKSAYTDAEELAIYREHKKLTLAIQMTATANDFDFVVRTGQNQGFRIEGTITSAGTITEKKKETSFNTCPICLTRGTLIATPDGQVPVEEIAPGMTVWSADQSRRRVAAEVIDTASTPVPRPFLMAKVTLSDGRTIVASPGHPTLGWRPLGDYRVGEALDGALVASVERVPYEAGVTYDILPSGPTGEYRANGVWLKSTLVRR
jgi:hypothetical protein